MIIKAPREVNLDYKIQAQKFDLNPYEGASLQLEGLYQHSKTNPSLAWVEGTILFFCTLFNPLENIKDGNKWCESLLDTDNFEQYILQSEAYNAIKDLKPLRVELDWGGV